MLHQYTSEMVKVASAAAIEKKTVDLKAIDISALAVFTDVFMIGTGQTPVQVKAIAEEIEMKMRDAGYKLLHAEGYDTGKWILLDYGDMLVHIFTPDYRDFYALERLWDDAETIELDNA